MLIFEKGIHKFTTVVHEYRYLCSMRIEMGNTTYIIHIHASLKKHCTALTRIMFFISKERYTLLHKNNLGSDQKQKLKISPEYMVLLNNTMFYWNIYTYY